MFSEENRKLIKAGGVPVVDEQWIKYNPTHKNYLRQPLDHHHEGQGRYAYAIPRKVHQKWTSILHQYKTTGKIPRIRPKINTMVGVLQLLTIITDIDTGNPDAWVNWFGNRNQVGRLYKHPEKGIYFVVTENKVVTDGVGGRIIMAKITYDVYDDYIWDVDEKRYMGVIKLGKFTEYVDYGTKISFDTSNEML